MLISGLASGFIAGLLGVGGGIILVPVLYSVFTLLEVNETLVMHLSVGTSLATIIVTSFISSLSHNKKNAVDLDLIKDWAAPLMVGIASGIVISNLLDGFMLTAIFASIACLVGCNMLFKDQVIHLSEELPQGSVKFFIAWIIGFLSTLMGIGGGTLSVPILNAYGYPIHRAIGSASAIGLIISIPATLGYIYNGLYTIDLPFGSFGFVNLIGFFLIAIASSFTTPMGANLAHKLDITILKRLFGFFLLCTSLTLFYRIIPVSG
ncbi:MAG: putative membrane protein YfcA [Chlamydiales bacterium]|jgi:uncharacterized membrane protein YfcA